MKRYKNKEIGKYLVMEFKNNSKIMNTNTDHCVLIVYRGIMNDKRHHFAIACDMALDQIAIDKNEENIRLANI